MRRISLTWQWLRMQALTRRANVEGVVAGRGLGPLPEGEDVWEVRVRLQLLCVLFTPQVRSHTFWKDGLLRPVRMARQGC